MPTFSVARIKCFAFVGYSFCNTIKGKGKGVDLYIA